jgi:signal transduction histidine kinase/CheY-like chemotaxis protein
VTELTYHAGDDPASVYGAVRSAALAEGLGPEAATRLAAAAAVAAVEREAAARSVSATEIEALRAELDETSRGLLAVYAELSDKSEELDRARTDAERAADAKAAFLANMSHEIRSPLNAVIGFTTLLQDTELTAEQAEYVGIVRGAGDHLRGVIDDILDLSKIESGRLELERIPFDLAACIEDAATMVAPRAEEKGLALATLFGPGAPDAVVGDPVRLRQILVNLLTNAVKFTKDGEVAVEVTGTADGLVRMAVRDTGIGIPEEALARVFAPFTQAASDTTRKYGGTGLGLSICRELAHRMGGGLEVTSTVGVGSTFTCTVLFEAAEPAPSTDPDLRGLRVLVAHGQPVVAESIRRPLSRWGADVVCGQGPPAAGSSFDLMLVDVRSPRDELTAAAAVVAVAGFSDRAPTHGRFLVRTPVRRAQLRDAVLGALGRQTGTGPARATAEPVQPLRILLAEDNPVNQRATKLLLGRLGHEVDVVPDGVAAVEAILRTDYDLVLMDLHMPRLDGVSATRQARLHRPGDRPQIVALTAGATDANRRACLHAGMNDFLAKPVDARELARVLAAAYRGGPRVTPTTEQLSHSRPRVAAV